MGMSLDRRQFLLGTTAVLGAALASVAGTRNVLDLPSTSSAVVVLVDGLGALAGWDALVSFLEQVASLQQANLELRDALLQAPGSAGLDDVRHCKCLLAWW